MAAESDEIFSTFHVMNTHNQLILDSLERFYAENPDALLKFKSMVHGPRKVSMRLIDWFITNYSKHHKVCFMKPDKTECIVFLEYRAMLDAGMNKEHFDSFCRGNTFEFHGVRTSIGQLMLFKWIIQSSILDWIESHSEDIQMDMELRASVKTKGMKRHALSVNQFACMTRINIPVKVSFI